MIKAPNPRFRQYGTVANYRTVTARMLTGRWDRGGEVAELERAMEHRVGAAHAVCCPKARVAIFLAVRALVRPGQQVILSPYTISDVVNMVICAGAKPVFADIDGQSCNISPSEIERLIGPNTGAVLVTHLHGLACQMDEIAGICADKNVPIIEDAAQAFGTRHKDRPVGTIGTFGVYSFGQYKNVNSLFGGMAVTGDPALADKIRAEVGEFPAQERGYYLSKMASAVATDVATWPPVFKALTYWVFRYGFLNDTAAFNRMVSVDNAPTMKRDLPESYLRRMTPTQAALVLGQLEAVDNKSQQRIRAAALYHQGLDGVTGVQLPPLRTDLSHTYSYFPIQVEDRSEVLKKMMASLRDVAAQHLKNCADLPCFSEFHRDCPTARRVADRVILLPTYPRYGRTDIDRTIAVIRSIFGA
jgi:dTDP-4-amino-4,6-dideoxygalactose transaminase